MGTMAEGWRRFGLGIGIAVLLAAGATALGQPAPVPATGPAGAYRVAEHRPYPEVIKIGEIVVYDPALKPRGIAGVGLTGDQVTRAIDRGRDFLWPILKKRVAQAKWVASRDDLLACLALMHAEAQKQYPEFDALVVRILDNINPECLGNYEAPLVIMMAECYGQKYAELMARTAQRVIDSQGPRGTFSYNWGDARTPRFQANRAQTLPAEGKRPLARAAANRRKPDGDNSVTQYAVLALWRTAAAGYGIEAQAWELCRQETAKRQAKDGGWAYNGPAPKSYGSMASAGVGTTSLCLIHQNKEPLDDPSVRRGLEWLVKNWSVSENPGSKDYLYYYIYGLERLGSILGTEFIGPHEWYPLGARFLVDNQGANGSWGKRDAEHDTCFALLFLTRATGSLSKPQTPGTLQTLVPEFAVFDKSGKEVARGPLGQSKTLPGGAYIVRVSIGDMQFEKAVVVPAGGSVTVAPADLIRSAGPTSRPANE